MRHCSHDIYYIQSGLTAGPCMDLVGSGVPANNMLGRTSELHACQRFRLMSGVSAFLG